MLLASIFFSGFFLPLENFHPTMRILTDALPLTHAIQGFQNIMLEGNQPSSNIWIMLGLISFVTFVLVLLFFRRLLRRL
jgi:ABC-2 type transport system permease protein